VLVGAINPTAVLSQSAASAPIKTQTPKPASHAMTNGDVIKMVKAGLEESLIAGAIRQAEKRDFTLTADGLIDLKTAGVSDNIIRLMLDPNAPAAAPVSASVAAPTAPVPAVAAAVQHEAGVYVKRDNTMVQLEPSVFSQSKTGGILTSGLTYGIKKAKTKAVLRGGRAILRVQANTELYMFFDSMGAGLQHTGAFTGFMQGASSPNEFVLVRLDESNTERTIVLGEFGAFGASTGTREKDQVGFKFEKLGPGEYKVVPETLRRGEYALFYAAGSNLLGAGNLGKLFDFGVD